MVFGDEIRRRGFLADEINVYKTQYRQEHREIFETCERLSDDATTLLFGSQLTGILNHELLALSLWQRAIRSCQAVVLLAERGMIPEARTQVRSAFEMLFFAVACLNDQDVVRRMEINDKKERLKMAEGMIAKAPGGHYSDAQLQSIRAVIEECSPAKNQSKYTVVEAAEAAGMAFLYENAYRGMSLDASHATVISTNHFFRFDQDGAMSPVFGPHDAGVQFTLSLIATCLEAGLTHFRPLLTRPE